MQHLRVFVVPMKRPWLGSSLSFGKALRNQSTRDRCLVAPSSLALATQTFRSIHSSRVDDTVTTPEIKKGFSLLRMLRKLGLPDRGVYKQKMNGYLLYEDIVINIDYENFFTDFKLPDTFYSWFVVMELHVWMLMIRCMAEGKLGQVMRNSIVEAMWVDVDKRKSKLKNASVPALKMQIRELSQQFNAAIIAYDEGILSDDKVLAGALWRRIFQYECNNPQDLERLVVFVRKQVNRLDRMSGEEFMSRKSVQWMTYEKP